MTLIVIRQNLTMAMLSHEYCRDRQTHLDRNPIHYEMNLHLRSVCLLLQTVVWLLAWLLSRHHLTKCQIANYLRELSVFHSLMILYHLDIDIWEMDP
jgi:hypothetical protein